MSATTPHPGSERRPVAWSVAGSDSGGGAGLQADLRAFDAFGVHGCTVVTAITAQNSVEVQALQALPTALVQAQVEALQDDLPPLAVKTGLLGSAEQARALARWLRGERSRRPVALVIDPVARASTGVRFADDALRRALMEELLPLADVVTPNRAEAGWLLGAALSDDPAVLRRAAEALRDAGASAVLLTGGDADEAGVSRDLMLSPQAQGWLVSPRAPTLHTHGSGCSFAAGIAAALALGFCEADAAVLAKRMVDDALARPQAAGRGAGPVRPSAGFPERAPLPHLRPFDAPPPPGPFARLDAPIGLMPIVDRAQALESLAGTGVGAVQLRIKRPADAQLSREVAAAVRLAERLGLRLFVNDHAALAVEHGAFGVHLGQSDLEDTDLRPIASAGLALGLSTHAPWEMARALALSPSYVACGPVHATRSKAMPWRPQGEGNLRHWCATVSLPVVAIGGMTPERAASAGACGADGVAVLGAIADAQDPAAAAREFVRAVATGRAATRSPPPPLPHPTLPRGAPGPHP